MKLFISAAEASSDAHGAALLKSIQETLGPSELLETWGVGGPQLQARGLKSLIDARELLSMGFTEALFRLPRILRALRQLDEALRSNPPDVAVLIDYPEFHFKLAQKLKLLRVPTLYYIPPKVWVWRKHRIHKLKSLFARVLSILPFEEEIYQHAGVPLTYVGNPLVDQLPFDLTRTQAREKLKMADQDFVLVALPGSRPSELNSHLKVMLDSAQQLQDHLRKRGVLSTDQKLIVRVPLPQTESLEKIRDRVEFNDPQYSFDLQVSQGDSYECMVAADVGMIKSGTSTLEAALLKCPHVIIYRPHWLTEWIFKWVIRFKGPVGLANLVYRGVGDHPRLIRELLCRDVTAEKITEEVISILFDPQRK